MNLFVCVYIYAHKCAYVGLTHVYTYIHLKLNKDIHIYIYTYIHIYIDTYIHIYIYTYIHIYIYTFLHVYIYTYRHRYASRSVCIPRSVWISMSICI